MKIAPNARLLIRMFGQSKIVGTGVLDCPFETGVLDCPSETGVLDCPSETGVLDCL